MIIDTNSNITNKLQTIRSLGITEVIRYFDPIGPQTQKCIKTPEAKAIAASGLKLGIVSEGWGDFSHGGISSGAGERDGSFCANYAPQIGFPKNGIIYFAIDVDASDKQIDKLVIPYFRAVKESIRGIRVGVYGSGNVCAAVLASRYAESAWLSCSMGWAGSPQFLASNKWAIRQGLPTVIAGVDCDPDYAQAGTNWGSFTPFADAA